MSMEVNVSTTDMSLGETSITFDAALSADYHPKLSDDSTVAL